MSPKNKNRYPTPFTATKEQRPPPPQMNTPHRQFTKTTMAMVLRGKQLERGDKIIALYRTYKLLICFRVTKHSEQEL
ncbi:hypothetical protein ACH3XW_49620 [Acanthocheilonema viteae]